MVASVVRSLDKTLNITEQVDNTSQRWTLVFEMLFVSRRKIKTEIVASMFPRCAAPNAANCSGCIRRCGILETDIK